MRFEGAVADDWAGRAVAAAGDFNGDGRDDVIVGATGSDKNGRRKSGSAYVLYGRKSADPVNVDLAALGARGMRIDGATAHDLAGCAVAGAGDVNGDGRDDVIVGTPGAETKGRRYNGAAFVVYGQESVDPADVDLAALGARGMRIDGATAWDSAGDAVAAAGDFNGDGRDDVIVGAPWSDRRRNSGSAYVVYGAQSGDPTDVDLAALGARGMRIDSARDWDFAGWAVAAGGDVNGDGRDDVIVGVPGADKNGRRKSGSAYVLYGRKSADPVNVDLAALGSRGMRIDGTTAGDDAGYAVAGAGDVNGDGRDDVVIGAPAFATDRAGSAYIVYDMHRR